MNYSKLTKKTNYFGVKSTSSWHPVYLKWYEERMDFLENLRNQEEKELIEKTINHSNKLTKKNKF